MQGFDDKFRDFPDYILGITKEIWEDRGIGPRLRDYYHRDVIVRMPGGISQGEPATRAATMATLHELPDRVLLGEDVIWCGTPETGLLSSHRILSEATHARYGLFGPASGKPLRYRIIADCFAYENQISDEWLIRDNGAIVRQLGHDPSDWVRARLDDLPEPFHPEIDVPGPYTGRGNDNQWGVVYADILTRLMDAEFSVIPAQYDRACHLEQPGGVTGHGHNAADAFWLGLRSSFPSARFQVHHQIGMEEPLLPPRASVRWSLTGRHDGWGSFGRPTGADVHVMGLCHADFGPNGLRREWALYDETAIWTQIHRAAG